MPVVKRENNIQCASEYCANCKKFQNKDRIVYRPTTGRTEDIFKRPGISETEIDTLELDNVAHAYEIRKTDETEIKHADFMSKLDLQINCPRCKTAVEHARNLANSHGNNLMHVCDHCLFQQNLRQKLHGKPKRGGIAIEHIKDIKQKGCVKTPLSKIQRLYENVQVDTTEKYVSSCLDHNKLHQDLPIHKPLIEKLLFYQDLDTTSDVHITGRLSYVSQGKKDNKNYAYHKNKNAALLSEAVSDKRLADPTYELRTQKSEQFRDRGLSLDRDFEEYYQHKTGIIEQHTKSYKQIAETQNSEIISDHLILLSRKNENLRKELQAQPRDYHRKYRSQETLFTNLSGVRDSLDKDFIYLFPRVVVDDISKRGKSSSELISDAKAAQQIAQKGKKKHEELLQGKRDRYEKGKSNKVKKIQYKMISSTDNLISEEVKEQETDRPENQEVQIDSVTNIRSTKTQNALKEINLKKGDKRPKKGKFEEKSAKLEKVENADIAEGRVSNKGDVEKNRAQSAKPEKVESADIAEEKKKKKDDEKKSQSQPAKLEKVENSDVADGGVKNDNVKKNKGPVNEKNISPGSKTESSSTDRKKVVQSTASELTIKRIKVVNADPGDYLLNLIKLNKPKPKILEQTMCLERAFDMKKHHKYYKCNVKPSFQCKEETNDSSMILIKYDKKISDVIIKGEKVHKNKSCLPVNIEVEETSPILFNQFFQEQALRESNLVSENERQLLKREKKPVSYNDTRWRRKHTQQT